MDRKKLKELLARHADQLVSGEISEDQLEELADDEQELAALLDVAKRVKSTLQPITPTDDFERELKRHLLTTAHLRQAEGYTPPNPSRDLMLIAAFIGFALSLTSVWLILKWRQASRNRNPFSEFEPWF